MNFTVENISALEKRVLFTVAGDVVEQKVNENLKEIGKTARLPGFRANKAPRKVIERHYGKRARAYAIQDIIQDSVREVVTKEEFHIIAAPSVDVKKEAPQLEFDAVFELYPEIGDINTKLYLTEPVVNIVQDDVEAEIERLRSRHVTWQESDAAAKDGDQVNIDFAGLIEGKPFEGGDAQSVDLVLGSGSMIAGFEDAIVGAAAGSNLTADLVFPEEYSQAPELSGKDVQFAITVNKVQVSRLPELDDSFFKKIGAKVDSLGQFKEHVEKAMQENVQHAKDDKVKQQLLEKLLINNPVDVPMSMVNREAAQQRKNMVMQYMGADAQEDIIPLDDFVKRAKKDVAVGLLLNHFIKENKIVAEASEVEQYIKDYLSERNMPLELLGTVLDNKQQYDNFSSKLIEEKAFDIIKKDSEITQEEQTYAQLLGIEKTEQE